MAVVTVLETLGAKIAGGEAATEADARELLAARDLIAVGTIADDVRRRLRGTDATFVRVLDVHVDAPPTGVPDGAVFGEVRVVGRATSLEQAAQGVRAAVRLAGTVPVTGFSLADLAELEGGRLEDVCRQLGDEGLRAIAEVPIDRFDDPAAAIEAARLAGVSVLRLTVHEADRRDPVALAEKARALQASVGGLLAFAPLPRSVPVAAPTTGYDDVKAIAAARVLAANIPSIQVDWVRYGPKLAQVALTTGADDVDGIVPGPGILGARRSPLEDIRKNIRAAGWEPVERNGVFERLAAEPGA